MSGKAPSKSDQAQLLFRNKAADLSTSGEVLSAQPAPGAMTIWYRLVETATAMHEASWESEVVAQRMEAQEKDAPASPATSSANARDGMHMLKHIHLADATMVDIGCGSGHWSRILADAPHPFSTWRYTGVEINAQRTTICQRLHPGLQFQIGRAEALPFADRAFDVVLASGVLQYVPRWQTALCEAARVGRAFAAVLRIPIIKYRTTALCRQIVRTPVGEEIHHFWMYERAEFERVADESGLRLVARDYTEECTRVEGLDERLFWLNYVFELS